MKCFRVALMFIAVLLLFSQDLLMADDPSFKLGWWKEPTALTVPKPPAPTLQTKRSRKKRETLFKRYENHDPLCPEGKKSLCNKYVFNVKLNKLMSRPLTTNDPYSSQTLCVGLCQKQAGMSWSLKWK